jgi:hypothetical protein
MGAAAATLIWLATLAALAATPPPQLRLAGPAVPGRWVLVTPLAPGQGRRLLSVGDGGTSVSLAGIPSGLAVLCAGGPAAATLCERRLIESNATPGLDGPVPGVRIAGGVRIGRRPAAAARVAFVPYPLALRKPFAVPLYRDGQKLVADVRTDAKGRFAAPLLAPGRYRLDVKLAGGRIVQGEPFQVPDPRRLRRQADPPGAVPTLDLGELVVDDGVEVAVGVADSAGRPIAGAGVGAIQEAEGKNTFFEATSDASGTARLAPLDPALPAAVSCQAPGYARFEERLATLPAALRCTLNRLSGIAGTVVDEARKPIAGATVSQSRDDRAARTGPAGDFTLDGLTAGEHQLAVAAPGFKAALRQVTVAAGERRQLDPIELATAGALEGLVVDGPTGEPIAGAAVSVAEPPGFGSATTGPDGTFALDAGGDAGLRLQVTAEGYPPTAVQVSAERQASGERLRIELYPGGRVKATVWDEEADAPCLACSVVLTPASGGFVRLTTDRTGEALSPTLAKGPCTAMIEVVEASGSMVRVHGGDNVRYVTIEPDKVVAVTFGERWPVLAVRFSPPLAAGWSLRAEGLSGALTVTAREDGTFAVRRHPGEPLVLSLIGPAGLVVRQASLPAGDAATALDLPLPQAQVGGTLMHGPEPARQARLTILAVDGTEAARGVTDNDGAFLVPFLPPGAYALGSEAGPNLSFTLAAGVSLDLGLLRGPDARGH